MNEASHAYYMCLNNAGSYWGMRLADILDTDEAPNKCIPEPAINNTSNNINDCLYKLLEDKNRCVSDYAWYKTELKKPGYWLLQLLVEYSSMVPALIGGLVITITAYIPLHILGVHASKKDVTGSNNLIVLDINNLRGAELETNDDTPPPEQPVVTPPVSPPMPPTLIQ